MLWGLEPMHRPGGARPAPKPDEAKRIPAGAIRVANPLYITSGIVAKFAARVDGAASPTEEAAIEPVPVRCAPGAPAGLILRLPRAPPGQRKKNTGW